MFSFSSGSVDRGSVFCRNPFISIELVTRRNRYICVSICLMFHMIDIGSLFYFVISHRSLRSGTRESVAHASSQFFRPCVKGRLLSSLFLDELSRNLALNYSFFALTVFPPFSFRKIWPPRTIRELKHARFWDADGNRKRTFRVPGQRCLPHFHTNHP